MTPKGHLTNSSICVNVDPKAALQLPFQRISARKPLGTERLWVEERKTGVDPVLKSCHIENLYSYFLCEICDCCVQSETPCDLTAKAKPWLATKIF